MIHFLVHDRAETVGVATVDIKAGETAKGLYMETQEPIEIKVLNNISGAQVSPAGLQSG